MFIKESTQWVTRCTIKSCTRLQLTQAQFPRVRRENIQHREKGREERVHIEDKKQTNQDNLRYLHVLFFPLALLSCCALASKLVQYRHTAYIRKEDERVEIIFFCYKRGHENE